MTKEPSFGASSNKVSDWQAVDFLGQNVRKYKNKRVIRPAKEGLKALLQKTRQCIKGCLGQTAETLIGKLNPIIRRG